MFYCCGIPGKVMAVNSTLPGINYLNSRLSLFGITRCSFVALAIRLYGLSLRIGHIMLYFLSIYYNSKFIF